VDFTGAAFTGAFTLVEAIQAILARAFQEIPRSSIHSGSHVNSGGSGYSGLHLISGGPGVVGLRGKGAVIIICDFDKYLDSCYKHLSLKGANGRESKIKRKTKTFQLSMTFQPFN
jgi:hypothetical protein